MPEPASATEELWGEIAGKCPRGVKVERIASRKTYE
jgi:hypothetical protein